MNPELSPDQKDQLYKARIAALVRKFTSGKRLSDAELSEIEPFIPIGVLRKHNSKMRGRDIYGRPRTAYAELYGATVRTINNWISAGLAKRNPPPLDDPREMPAWWGAVMDHRVPDKLYSAASRFASSNPPSEPSSSSVKVPPSLSDESETSSPSEEEPVLSTGFLASLLRTRDEEAKAHRRYKKAADEDPPDEGKIRTLQKTWQDLADHLRSLEKAAPEVLRKSGDMWLGVDIIRELAEIHGVIQSGVRSLLRRWAVKTGREVSVSDDRAFQDEVDRLFSRLQDSKFRAHE